MREIILRRSFHSVHQALSDVSFRIEDGETLGIIGPNGAGKSTLLKILTGVLIADTGRIDISGRITGLLELGTGFTMDMTGVDNIHANAMLLGMNPAQVRERRDAIIDFAELGDFIAEPLKTYSSGMLMRLAFAIAIHADPVCFVVDEALSVGDAYFQQKCMRAIQAFRERGGSILFVSHDLSAVKMLCDTAILLEDGRIIDQGVPAAVVDHYHARMLKHSHGGDVPAEIHAPSQATSRAPQGTVAKSKSEPTMAETQPLIGTGQVRLLGLHLLNADGEPVEAVTSESPLTIIARIQALKDLDQPHYGIGVRNRFGHSVFETNTHCMGQRPEPVSAGQSVAVTWRFDANLVAGDYSVTVGVGNRPYGTGSFEEILFFAHELAMLSIETNPNAIRYDGYFNMHPQVAITEPSSERA
nr:ABC transporter ATP-binding protein [Thiorhodovibrio winogradskyi]